MSRVSAVAHGIVWVPSFNNRIIKGTRSKAPIAIPDESLYNTVWSVNRSMGMKIGIMGHLLFRIFVFIRYLFFNGLP